MLVRIDDGQHRAHRRGGGEVIAAHQTFGEILQIVRLIVPFDIIANDDGLVMRAVRPFHAGPALRALPDIAGQHDRGHLIAERVVDGHRGMLQADDAMYHRGQRLAGDLGVAMRHGHRSFFMHAGDELWLGVHAVIDDRFLQAAEGRTGAGCDIVDVERPEAVDHEVRAGLAAGDEPLSLGRGLGVARGLGLGRDGGARRRSLRRDRTACGGQSDGGTGGDCSSKELTALHLRCLGHGSAPVFDCVFGRDRPEI